MPTLMEFIVSQSTLPVGNTVRDHIENPGGGTGQGETILLDGLEVEMDCTEFDAEIDLQALEAEVEFEVEVELESTEFEAEVCDG